MVCRLWSPVGKEALEVRLDRVKVASFYPFLSGWSLGWPEALGRDVHRIYQKRASLERGNRLNDAQIQSCGLHHPIYFLSLLRVRRLEADSVALFRKNHVFLETSKLMRMYSFSLPLSLTTHSWSGKIRGLIGRLFGFLFPLDRAILSDFCCHNSVSVASI